MSHIFLLRQLQSALKVCTLLKWCQKLTQRDTKTTLSTDLTTNTLTQPFVKKQNQLLSSEQPFNTSNTNFQQKKTPHSNSYLITIQNLHDNREAIVIC